MIFRGIQVVWWGEWVGIRSLGPYPLLTGSVYLWRYCLGLFEIRRFAPDNIYAANFWCDACGYTRQQENGPYPSPDEVCPACGAVMEWEVL